LPANKQRSLFIVPEIFYTLNPTTLVKGRSWSVNSLSIGVGFKYRVPPPPPPPPLAPVPPPDPEIPIELKQPVLAVDVDAVEIDSNNVKQKDFSIGVEDFISINMRPLLNYLFFDENSAEIPKKYVQFSKNDAEKFDESYLGNLNAMETYYYLLNIVGKRLQTEPGTTITLTGTNSNINSEKNNKELSKARAQSVANYLTNTWNIDPSRIKIVSRNLPEQHSKEDDSLGMQENRRVEITSDNIRITEPVLTKDTMRIIKTSEIDFLPKVLTEAGLQLWELNVKQKDKTLFAQKGSGNPPESLQWKIAKHNELADEGDISYSINAIDSVGQTANSKTKRIPVNFVSIDKKRRAGEQDKEFEYYSLILFDYGKSDLGFEHRKVVDFVKGRINPDSKLVVYGYTDSMGEEKVNDRISKERATAVLKRLDIKDNVQIEGKGESELLYDNSLPEGRFYCRTVTIDIETPINHNQK
jgi:outer membrane protein OmpA-like peptidoglycan-associated protein